MRTEAPIEVTEEATDEVMEDVTEEAITEETAEEAVAESTEAKEELTVSGTISDIKDFGFVLTTEDEQAYMLTFDPEAGALEGFDTVKDGDKIVVTYTGELSEVDNTATLVKVELAK